MRAPRLSFAASALALAVSLAGRGTARAEFGDDEKKFPNQAYPAELRTRVEQAILRGANWLLRSQAVDGSFAWRRGRGAVDARWPIGPSALATLALLKSGLPPGHPAVERAFTYLRKQALTSTYEVAVLLMAIDAKYDPIPDPFAKDEVDRYGNRLGGEPCVDRISKDDLAWMKDGVDFLVKNQSQGHWRYPSGGFDLSNTQYALLGLKAAQRCGLKVPTQVWLESLDFLLEYQETEGADVSIRVNEVKGDYRVEWTEKAKARGFRYTPEKGMPVTGSMTTAGAAGLLICQGELWKSRKFTAERRAKTRLAVRDAAAWMQAHFDVSSNPGMGLAHHYYYLYGLERMGILSHVRFFGKWDWYGDGAELLLLEQEDPGSWMDGDLVDSCFALLFLKRSSSSLRTQNPVLTLEGPTPTKPAPGAGGTPPSGPTK